MSNTEFKLQYDEAGETIWTHSSVRIQNKLAVLRLLDDGISQIDISKTLGITKGRVSQIVNEAKKDGFISSKGNLTQTGFMEI